MSNQPRSSAMPGERHRAAPSSFSSSIAASSSESAQHESAQHESAQPHIHHPALDVSMPAAAAAAAASSSSSSSALNRHNSMRRLRAQVKRDVEKEAAVLCSAGCGKQFKTAKLMQTHKNRDRCSRIRVDNAPPVADDDMAGGGGDIEDEHHSDYSPVLLVPSRPVSPGALAVVPPRPPSPPRAAAAPLPSRLAAVVEWNNTFAVAYQSRHRLTAIAMNEYLAHQAQLIPMLLVAGMGAQLRVLNVLTGQYDEYAGPASPGLPRVEMPRPRESLMTPVRANAAGLAPWSIHTPTINGDIEPIPHKRERKPTPSTVYEPKNPPKLMVDVAELVGVNRERYDEYAICPNPNCGALYKSEDAKRIQKCTQYCAIQLEQPAAGLPGRTKSHDEHHDRLGRDRSLYQCGTQLISNRTNEPILPYPYLGVIGPLKEMLKRDGFEKKCELWRDRYNADTNRRLQSHTLADIYDGQLWQDYMFVHRETKKLITDADIAYHRRVWEEKKDGPVLNRPANRGDVYHPATSIPLLARGGTLALAINVDWYQPFNTVNFSLGAIYLTVLNLPREERYLTENMILVGVLPGPKATSREQLQGALRPLMAELNELFGDGNGMSLTTRTHPAGKNVTAFLHSVICDSPAARMMSGGMNHGGNNGCPYCKAGGTGGSGGTFTNCSGIAPHHGKKQMGAHWGPATIGHSEQWNTPKYRRTDATSRRSALEWTTATYVAGKLSCDHVPIAAVGGEELRAVEQINEEFDQENQVDKDVALDDNDLGDEEREEEKDDKIDDDDAAVTDKELKQRVEGRKRHASLYGNRYCALMDLPYFDMRRGIPMDVMHNIYLGLCKEMMVLLTKFDAKKNPNPIIKTAALNELQAFMERCQCPSDVGAMPGKIAASMDKFKAAEWMNWMTIFCVPAMRHLYMGRKKPERLTEQHIELLSHMQRVSGLMQANVITLNQVEEVRLLLRQVIDRVEQIWPSGTDEELKVMADAKDAAFSKAKARAKEEAVAKKQNRGRKTKSVVAEDKMDEGDEEEKTHDDPRKKQKIHYNAASSSSSSSSVPAASSSSSSSNRKVREHIKPNLHYAQHLWEQILDFGPPVNWWCNSYERFNGLLAGVPRTPTHIEICTMRRHLVMHDAAQHASEQISEANRIVDAAPFTPGHEHYEAIATMLSGVSSDVLTDASTGEWTQLRTTASSRTSVEYAFGTGEKRIDNYTKFVQRRQFLKDGQFVESPPPLPTPIAQHATDIRCSYIEVTGSERYPGRLMGARLIDGQRFNLAHHAAFNTSSTGRAGMLPLASSSSSSSSSRAPVAPLAVGRDHEISARIITECLLIHYATVYDITKEIHHFPRLAASVEPIVADSYWHNLLDDKQKMMYKIPYLQENFNYHIEDEFEVYDSLTMGGESYGSTLTSIKSKDSYVTINCRVYISRFGKGAWPSKAGLISEPYYARIQYFIRHKFMGQPHDFAVVRWHDLVLEATAAEQLGYTMLESAYNVDDEERFRWVKATTLPVDQYILIPVQRLLHRWIPHVMPDIWQVCPMQTKVHV